MFNLNGITVATFEFQNGVNVVFSPSDVALTWDATVVSDKTGPIYFFEKNEGTIQQILAVCSTVTNTSTSEEIVSRLYEAVRKFRD